MNLAVVKTGPGVNVGRRHFRRGSFARVSDQFEKRCTHLITLSALASTFCEIVKPLCFAVFTLIASSNLVGCSIGKSAGLAPLRILST
jgi:hypothetical protein